MKTVAASLLLMSLVLPVSAWSDKGHMVAARIAWNKLNDAERTKVVGLLKKHPDYQEYLAADRPKGFSDDEWVFLRAATWADWIRDKHKDGHDHWHQISYPYVPHGSKIDPKDHEPPRDQQNVVTMLPVCVRQVKEGSATEKAKYLAWVFHLVGDIHQPLHCTSRFDDQFPKGDDNAMDALVRIDGHDYSLHQWWDSATGNETSQASIDATVKDVDKLLRDHADQVREDMEAHKSFESWAREGFGVAVEWAYLDGRLKTIPKPKSSSSSSSSSTEAPEAPENYESNAKRIAKIQLGKAGLRLTDEIRRILAALPAD